MSRIISGTQAAIFCSFNKCVYNTTAGSRLGLFSLAERNIIDQWKYSVEIRSAVVMSTKVCKLKMAVMISGSYFVKYCFWSIVLLRNHGQKNASAQLFIMILPSSIRLLQRIDNTIFKREGKHKDLVDLFSSVKPVLTRISPSPVLVIEWTNLDLNGSLSSF